MAKRNKKLENINFLNMYIGEDDKPFELDLCADKIDPVNFSRYYHWLQGLTKTQKIELSK